MIAHCFVCLCIDKCRRGLTQMQRPEEDVRYLSQVPLPHILFETGSLVEPEACPLTGPASLRSLSLLPDAGHSNAERLT